MAVVHRFFRVSDVTLLAALGCLVMLAPCLASPISSTTTATATAAAAAAAAADFVKLEEPCQPAVGSTDGLDLAVVMAALRDGAEEIMHSADAYKTFLTASPNPRVPSLEQGMLDVHKVHVKNFPHDFTSNPLQNISQALITDYIFLSKLYIFYNQTLVNLQACDTRSDADQGEEKVKNVLHRTVLTLCDVHTYLRASQHPMPADKVPSGSQVLASSDPVMDAIPDTCAVDTTNLRNHVDYVNARDTTTAAGQLHEQYKVLYERLSSQGNASN